VLGVIGRVTVVAESHFGERDRIDAGTDGSKWPSASKGAHVLDDFPVRSMREAIEQDRAAVGNPDALLSLVDGPGIDAGDRH
jgi:hypothetical protein